MAPILATKTHGDEMPSYSALQAPPSDGVDDPAAAGVSITGGKGDIALNDPYMAILGEPLDAMVKNLGQSNNGYASADTTNDVLSQGFTTGPALLGYRLQGIGVTSKAPPIESLTGRPPCRWPCTPIRTGSRARSWSNLVSPTEYAAGHSFFEAPPGTYLEASTSYVMV